MPFSYKFPWNIHPPSGRTVVSCLKLAPSVLRTSDRPQSLTMPKYFFKEIFVQRWIIGSFINAYFFFQFFLWLEFAWIAISVLSAHWSAHIKQAVLLFVGCHSPRREEKVKELERQMVSYRYRLKQQSGCQPIV